MARSNYNIALPGIVDLHRPNGAQVSGWPNLVTARRMSETTSGVSRRKPKGWKPPTAYSLTSRDVSYQTGYCLYYNTPTKGSTGQWYTGVVGCPESGGRFNGEHHFNSAISETDAIADLGLRNAALTAARNNLKNTSINLGVAFGERKQTARLIGDTASRLARSVRYLKRGSIRKAMDELGISSRKREPRGSNVPQKWLEMQYGWKPLLSDVYGAADALSKHPTDHWRVTAKATRSRVDQYAYDKYPGSGSGFDACECRAQVRRSVFARIDAIPDNAAKIALASTGVTNPLLVGWELVPFSFVVDWFIPIGNYVESLDAMLGYTEGYYTSSLFVRAEWTDKGRSGTVGSHKVINDFYGYKKLIHLSRTAQAGVPLSKLPRFKDPRSLGHMANGLALLAQVFGRR